MCLTDIASWEWRAKAFGDHQNVLWLGKKVVNYDSNRANVNTLTLCKIQKCLAFKISNWIHFRLPFRNDEISQMLKVNLTFRLEMTNDYAPEFLDFLLNRICFQYCSFSSLLCISESVRPCFFLGGGGGDNHLLTFMANRFPKFAQCIWIYVSISFNLVFGWKINSGYLSPYMCQDPNYLLPYIQILTNKRKMHQLFLL